MSGTLSAREENIQQRVNAAKTISELTSLFAQRLDAKLSVFAKGELLKKLRTFDLFTEPDALAIRNFFDTHGYKLIDGDVLSVFIRKMDLKFEVTPLSLIDLK